jgi:cellulose biosynthesis protein BcsQ
MDEIKQALLLTSGDKSASDFEKYFEPTKPNAFAVSQTLKIWNLKQIISNLKMSGFDILVVDVEVTQFKMDELRQLKSLYDQPLLVVALAMSDTNELNTLNDEKGGFVNLVYEKPIPSESYPIIEKEIVEAVERLHRGFKKGAYNQTPMELQNYIKEFQGTSFEKHLIISTYTPKGGVGKTWVSYNIAAVLALTGGMKTLLIDANMNGGHIYQRANITANSGRKNSTLRDFAAYFKFTSSNIATLGNTPEEDKRKQYNIDRLHKEWNNELENVFRDPHLEDLHIIPGVLHQAEAENDALVGAQGEGFIESFLKFLKNKYDFIIVDNGSSMLSGIHYSVANMSDRIFMIVDPTHNSLMDAKFAIEQYFVNTNHFDKRADQIRIVFNKYEDGVGVTKGDVLKVTKSKIAGVIPNDSSHILLADNNRENYYAKYVNETNNELIVEEVLDGVVQAAAEIYAPVAEIFALRNISPRKVKSKKSKKSKNEKGLDTTMLIIIVLVLIVVFGIIFNLLILPGLR